MNIVDIIENKKLGKEHSKEEINYIIDSLMNNSIADYQISAWLMAVYFQGLTENETIYLTDALIQSGDIINLQELTAQVIDIHSIGGVGDKLTITLIPLMVAAGVPMIKLLGQGIGYTGGTIDKLKAIPGFNTGLAIPDILNQLKNIKVAISNNIHNIAPANRSLQAIKYTTSIMDSIPLITASVMSKKIATGAGNIIIDVKYGSGASLQTAEDAEKLANLMINVGKNFNKTITTIITSMDEPLGRAIGNAIEVIEAIEFLKGNIKSGDLVDLSYEFAATALVTLKRYKNIEQAKEYLKYLVDSGKAIETFRNIIKKQKGNDKVIDSYDLFDLPQYRYRCRCNQNGFVNRIDGYKIAYACKLLGAVRMKNNDDIDRSVGIFLNKKTGEKVKEGDTLFTIYTNKNEDIELVKKYCYDAYSIAEENNYNKQLVYKVIRGNENV